MKLIWLLVFKNWLTVETQRKKQNIGKKKKRKKKKEKEKKIIDLKNHFLGPFGWPRVKKQRLTSLREKDAYNLCN